MIADPIRLLLLEDNEYDAALLQAWLNESAKDEFIVTRAKRLSDALAKIRCQRFDAVLSDLGLPDSIGLATVQALASCAPQLPLVVLTGSNDEDIARAAIQGGAQDYLVKGELSAGLMVRALRYAVERKRLELALREANQKLSARARKLAKAVEQSPVSIVITDRYGKIEYTNPRFTQVTGYAQDEVIGKNPRVLQSGETLAATYRELWANLMDGREWHGVFRNRRKNGTLFWEEASISPMLNDLGKITHFVAVKEDITERKQLEQGLIEASEEAHALVKRKAVFLANMSHEIRTPMNGVMGLIELVLGTELGTEQRENLELAYSSARGLLTVINDVLDFSKIDAGKLELENRGIDLRKMLDQSLRMFAREAIRKGLRFASHVADDIPTRVVGDSARLRQIIVNLLGNAIKFTDAGEVSVGVTTHAETEKELVLRFAVSDTGIGIPSDRTDAVFKAFVQVDSSISGEYGGTGLGLSICNSLVKLMNGSIWVESEAGKGSTFYFTATLGRHTAADEPHETPDAARSPRSSARRGLHILLAEDNPVNRKFGVGVLTAAGHQVTVAKNGKEAIDLACASRFDVILMDLLMPVIDGFSASRIIRSHGIATPIIALTAHALKGMREESLNAGMNGFLSKPIQGSALLAKLDEVLREASGSAPESERVPVEMPGSASASLDLNAALRLTDGDVEALRTMAGMVVAQIREDLPGMRELSAAQNSLGLYEAAHKLKSSLACVGANAARDICLELEALAHDGRTADFAEKSAQLEAELDRVALALSGFASQSGIYGSVEK